MKCLHLWHGPMPSFRLNKFFNLTITLTAMTIHWFCGKPPWPSFENSRGEIQNQHRDFSISPMESQSRTASFHPTRLGSPYRWCKIVPGKGLLAAHKIRRRPDFAPYAAGPPPWPPLSLQLVYCKSGSHKNGIRKSSRKTYNLIMGI